MLDSNFRDSYQKVLINPLLKLKFIKKIDPNFVTILSTFFGIFSFFLIISDHKYLAVLTLLISGYLDTLDGSIARISNNSSNIGAILDIFSDRIVEMLIIVALFLVDPIDRSFLSILMISSSYLCITSFLVVGIFFQNSSEKSFYYSTGMIERTEAFIFFIAMIVFHKYFKILALTFSVLVFLTAFIRVCQLLLSKERSMSCSSNRFR
ncbi:MAG: Inner membrane protein YnjF [Candidatus Anoxychlamydiales bacterium]|nr:Inner membrane protein YnjF [Candidatus Anoxychlamydiales bacterium]NGX40997.1 Inner membrane protein YnjF [Candidatus Anoxychlamydiales bacterium]HEU64600.1 CDP-alcohol phosphatidyltransferase family protein [Chlamydiota bacterium]